MFNPIKGLQGDKLSDRKHIGTVVDNNDPLKLGRVRIRTALHEGLSDGAIPWAIPCVSAPQGIGGGVGWVGAPVIGSKVMLEFQDDTLHHPIFSGSPMTTDIKSAELTAESYPNVYGFIDHANNKICVDTLKKEITIHHVAGTKIFIDARGKVDITTSDDFNLNVNGGGNCHVATSNTVVIEAAAKIDLKAGVINLNPSGPAAPAPATPR